MSVWKLDYSSFQQLFANEYSLKILSLIYQKSTALCAADVSKLLDIHISTAKKYLSLLAENNLLQSEKYLQRPGKPTYYSLLNDRFNISLDLSHLAESMDVPTVSENIPNPRIREKTSLPSKVQLLLDIKDMVTEISVKVQTKAKKTISHKIILNSLRESKKSGACVVAVPVKDTIKRVENNKVLETLPRELLYQIQTPQTFLSTILTDAHKKAKQQNFYATDEAALVEWAGYPVSIVAGDYRNIKITTVEDLKIAEIFMEGQK